MVVLNVPAEEKSYVLLTSPLLTGTQSLKMYCFLHTIALFGCESLNIGELAEYSDKIILAFMLWYPLLTPAFSIKPCCATAAIQGSNKMSPISQLEIKN